MTTSKGLARMQTLDRRIGIGFVVTVALCLCMRGHSSAASGTDSLSWIPVAAGVNYATADSTSGDDIFLGFGGWTVQQAWANNWIGNLHAARLRSLGVRHLYSVMGPQDDDYGSREIGTLDLARHLLTVVASAPPDTRILLAAHSSGAYVAHAFFQDLYDAAGIDSAHLTDGKIIYFNLDGGIGAGGYGVELTQAMANRLGHVYGVAALIPASNLYSPNSGEMEMLGGLFGTRSTYMIVDATGCGCTGKWCVHETLINQKPYNHTTFDLKNDYGSINADHPVTTAYLDVITGLEKSMPKPEGFRLEQNYPNPFNPTTVVSYQLPVISCVKLAVFDMLGREVHVLVNDRRDAGIHEVAFDGIDLSSGVYFCRLQARPADGRSTGEFIQTKRLVLVK